ncbi:MAG: transglycosylase SLT domain-containing protein [Stenotrophobium sp.]
MGKFNKRFWCAGVLALCLGWLALPAAASDSGTDTTIWPRLAKGMTLTDDTRPEVRKWARYYAHRPRALEGMMIRARPYFWHIVQAVDTRGMPLEIALLPAVESGFKAGARSPQQAQGIWQFMPATARLYGLRENASYDARQDPLASTDAALHYLQGLHARYGDWLLALAAYNAGEVRVTEAMHQGGTNDFWTLDLPQETRAHVARLLGLALAIREPHRYRLRLPRIPDRPVTDAVRLDTPINLAQTAKAAGLPLNAVTCYNPGLKNIADTSSRKTLLLLPSDAARLREQLARQAFAPGRNLATAAAVAAVPVKHVHIVRAGENLWGLARRYQTSVRQLREWNELETVSLLKPGQKLRIAALQ